ncbi:SpaA isopeptide-forming pilin-related protein [Olsenella profusa]|uniref:VaFE repeat-containing surface-anchored protein n=1 Tax=Olsenella profusa TaxID=138595 RepID=A0ABS2F390_9ACTN|nr:VaFE repeat-containing surface-anchored protein [Olsenella profusa]
MRALLVALALALSQVLGVLGAAPQAPAEAADLGTMTITGVTDIQDWPDITATFRNFQSFTVSGGGTSDGVGWCAAKTLSTPSVGTTFTGGRPLNDPRVDYVLYHGYSSDATEGYGLTPGKFYVATQYALWLVLPDVGGSHAEVEDELTRTYADVARVVRQLVSEADAYAAAGGGGACAGCAVFWPSPNGATQSMLTRTNPAGSIALQKASASPEVTDGNDLYSLAGAVYGVYSDEGCQTQVATMTTDESGSASAGGLPVGTYYVREVTPSPGFSLDPTVYPVSVGSGATTRVSAAETPQSDVGMAVRKLDAVSGAAAQGDATLEGAEFTVSYYAGLFGSVAELPETPVRTWVLRTDAEGRTSLALAQSDPATYLVSGDDLYLTSDGRATVPLGTLTVQETKAPNGYLLPEDAPVSLVQVTGSGTGELVTVLAESAQEDAVVSGGVSVPKIDHELAEGVAQGDATLAGAVISIVNESRSAVVVGGVSYEPGQEVMTIVTGTDGTAATGAHDLPYGTYRLSEKSAPNGYLLNEEWSVTVSVQQDGVVVEAAELPEDVARGAGAVVKVDGELSEATAQGDATLAGAVLDIYNRSDSAVLVDGVLYQPGDVVATIETEGDGSAVTAARALPFGTYEAREREASEGYLVNEGWSQTFEIREDGQVVTLESLPEPIVRGGVSVRKVDADWDASLPQGDATLAGAEFEIVNRSAAAVLVDGESHQPGEVVATIRTGEDGTAATAANALPYGTYEVRESVAPEGYQANDEWSRTVQIRADGQVSDLTGPADATADEVVRGGVSVRKTDRELQVQEGHGGSESASRPLGGATLAGAQFEVVNESKGAVVVDGATYETGEVVCTLVTDEEGRAATAGDALPYGTYTVTEALAPMGYLPNDDWSRTFEVREEGVVVDLSRDEDAVADQVVRGDISLVKAEEGTQSRMAHVPFRLTSQTTGEWHLVMTDENGMLNTEASWNSHESATNANDAALREDGTVDDALLDSAAGVWFSGRTDATTVPDDELGALPFDTYLLEELPCAANEGHRLVSTRVSVSRHAVNLDLGTMDDEVVEEETPEIRTTLLSDVTASHNAPGYDRSTVTDTAALSGLVVGRTYTVRGTLRVVDVDEGGAPVPGEKIAEAEITFEATDQQMEVQLTFEVDGSELAGRTVNAAETLLEGDAVVATHDDAGDEDQSVSLPAVTTLAANAATGTSTSPEATGQTLVDTVGLSGLVPGERYLLRGTVHAKDVSEDGAVTDGGTLAGADGGEATAEVEFVADQASMSVEVEIPYDASGLAGRDTVAFEELYDKNGILLAAHADVEDAYQTLHVPSVSTQAMAESTGTQELPAESEQVVTDTVHVGNLSVGETYELVATLHAKGRDENGEVTDLGELTGADGSAITATKTFVAEAAEMDVELSLTVDADVLAGREVVFFEELRQAGVTLALHADINDAAQTLRVPAPEEPEQDVSEPASGMPNTGEPASIAATICAAGVGLAGVGGLTGLLRRRHQRLDG